MQLTSPAFRPLLLNTLSYYSNFIFLGLVSASLGPALPYLAENTQSSIEAISILFAARSFGYLLGALGGGRLYDSIPGHRLMIISLIIMAVALWFTPLAKTLILLAIIMMLVGATESVVDIGGNTLLIWLHREKVGPFMNGLHFSFGIGAFLIPLIIDASRRYFGSPAQAFYLLALLVIPLMMSLWLRLPLRTAVKT
ncbi:MAG: MFS transporter [Deinococcales bacterium]